MDNYIPLRPKAAPHDHHFSCPTCQDEGLPGRVLTLDAASNTALVKMDHGETQVALDLLDNVQVGEYLLIHIGTAIAKLNPSDVIETTD